MAPSRYSGAFDIALPEVLASVTVTNLIVFVMLRTSTWIDQRVSARAHRTYPLFMGLIILVVGAQLLLTGVHSSWSGGSRSR